MPEPPELPDKSNSKSKSRLEQTILGVFVVLGVLVGFAASKAKPSPGQPNPPNPAGLMAFCIVTGAIVGTVINWIIRLIRYAKSRK